MKMNHMVLGDDIIGSKEYLCWKDQTKSKAKKYKNCLLLKKNSQGLYECDIVKLFKKKIYLKRYTIL